MTSTPRAPKQWKLTKDETINSFESWRQNLLYGFSQEKIFAPFLETTWQKKTATNPHRGLQDDGSSVPEAKRLTATQKNTHLELLLGQIANFCPIVSRSSIIKNSVSLNDVWQKIRLHYGFQSTGAHFLDLSNIHLSPDERPEDLYQRLMAFFEDNLLTVGGGISHQGETISTDEDLTPTLENTIVFLWLQLINPGLPQLVKQKYGSELRNKSLASLKPEISQALSSLLDELRSIEDSKAMRVGNTLSPRQSPFPGTGYARPRRYVSCILCKTAGRPHTTHSLVDCRFVPQRDRRLLASSRLVCDDPEECDPIDYSASEEVCDLLVSPTPAQPTAPSAQRVRIVQSPVLSTFYESHPVPLTLDTGATSNIIRVYTRSAMGMPGSETCLEELMSRVLGDLIQEGCVAKIADDLYVGGISFEDALQNWQRVLEALKRNNLRLSASKTIVCPRTATILGWIWSKGTLQASPHKLATLSSVAPPSTVQGLRSFVGSYKVLSRVLPRYADLLDPLDQATAEKESREKIIWTDDLTLAFQTAQKALRNHKSISIPRPSDSLWIVTDGSVKNRGIAATMYIHRNGKLLLAGFFNAKLRKHQVTWLPCEIEALAIGAAIKHFSPYIVQSPHTTQLLTDSRPCVQAYDKLKRGEFSTSSRVTTFLSTVSRYLVHVRHIAGIDNLPSDFASRNPIECRNSSCQICKFIAELEDSVVRTTTVDAVPEGSVHMPFTSCAAWQATQQDCSDLRRTHAHLSQSTRPSKKETNLRDIKRYLKDVIIAADGLLVVRDSQPFQPIRERIVVPRSVLSGLLTALHIRFHHPSKYQTKRLFNRYFFALDTDKAIETLTSFCHHCQSLKAIPRHLQPQSSSDPPATIGVSFAADIVKRYRQLILVLRETVSSYTLTSLIESEKREHLRDGLLILSVGLRSLCDHGVTIRVDPAPGFSALHNDKDLLSHGIKLELGHAKNPNKNPAAERAVEELGLELLNISPEGGPISRVTLALATANLNSRIRRDGLSACELWTQHDQLTGEQLPIVDRQVILNQHRSHLQNHPSSSVSKASGKPRLPHPTVSVGTLVFLVCDKSKLAAREKYLIVGLTDSNTCQLRKFTSSQFRSKVYTVPISQCFPVSPTMLAQDPQGPIRGLNEPPDSDSDDDPDPLDLTSETTLPTPPPIPDAIAPRQPDPEVPLPTAPEQPRRSTRPVRPPSWRTSDYVYD